MSEQIQPAISFGTRVRRSPYFEATRRWGCPAYTVYNHMYMPAHFNGQEGDYWTLVRDVSCWDVAAERQVEIAGPDASRFVQLLTPRNLATCAVGKCRYVPITDENGGLLNDPLLLRLAEDRYWLSIADSDLLLWCKAVAWRSGMAVTIFEPDASPLAVQGPKSLDTLLPLFGDELAALKYYNCYTLEWEGIPLVISRSGWSAERGYEIYLCDASQGDKLWEAVMAAGKPHGIAPGAPNQIRRLEAGMLSYGSDMTLENNPFEAGMEAFVDLEMEADFIGKAALKRIAAAGPARRLVGVEIGGERLNRYHGDGWPVLRDGEKVGSVTSSVYSPRLDKNIGLAMVPIDLAALDTALRIAAPAGERAAKVVPTPFYDPKKQVAKSS